VAQSGQPYAYTGDDPVNGVDPTGLFCLGLCSFANAAKDVSNDVDDVGHFLKDPNRWRAEADYLAAVGNGIVSTFTLGHVHISAPYCGYGLASDLGNVIGTALSLVVGGDLGGVADVLKGTETVEEAEATAEAAETEVSGYSSFRAAKADLGSPGTGKVFDHVVEQSQIGRSGFAPEDIHNPFNLDPVDAQINQLKANYYSSKTLFSGGATVRDWLTGQSFADQYDFGMRVNGLLQAGVSLPK
jgi:hypothetical protein